MTKSMHWLLSALAVVLMTAIVTAQGRGQPPPPAYPPRAPVAPAILERGKTVYSVHCAFCHGPDARGGDGGGPNLLRSQLVLSDQKGELIGEVIRNGRPGTVMTPMTLTATQISDVSDFIHSFRVGGYDISRETPRTIVVGDAKAGEAAFKSRCSACHSTTGDLKALGTRFSDPQQLQNMWLMPSQAGGRSGTPASNVRPTTVTVTLASGQRVEGRLIRIDDFVVTLAGPDGMPRSFGRNGDEPRVEINDPLKPHRDLLPKYTDTEIHDITAYLVTVK